MGAARGSDDVFKGSRIPQHWNFGGRCDADDGVGHDRIGCACRRVAVSRRLLVWRRRVGNEPLLQAAVVGLFDQHIAAARAPPEAAEAVEFLRRDEVGEATRDVWGGGWRA